MDTTLKVIGGVTLGCFGLAAIAAVAVLFMLGGAGWLAKSGWDRATAEAEMRKALEVTPTLAGTPGPQMPVRLEIANLGSRDISSFVGTVDVLDKDFRLLMSGEVAIATPLAGHAARTETLSLDYRRTPGMTVKAADVAHVQFTPERVVFADGSSLGR